MRVYQWEISPSCREVCLLGWKSIANRKLCKTLLFLRWKSKTFKMPCFNLIHFAFVEYCNGWLLVKLDIFIFFYILLLCKSNQNIIHMYINNNSMCLYICIYFYVCIICQMDLYRFIYYFCHLCLLCVQIFVDSIRMDVNIYDVKYINYMNMLVSYLCFIYFLLSNLLSFFLICSNRLTQNKISLGKHKTGDGMAPRIKKTVEYFFPLFLIYILLFTMLKHTYIHTYN